MNVHYVPLSAPTRPNKYDRFAAAHAACGEEALTLPFAELDHLIPGGLPWTARRRASWWQNEASDATCKSHVRAWNNAGYVVAAVDLRARRATFRRTI